MTDERAANMGRTKDSAGVERTARRRWRWLVPLTLGVALLAPSAVGADGHEVPEGVTDLGEYDGWTAFSGRFGFVYGAPGEDYIAFAGEDLATVCSAPPAEGLALTRQQADGTWTTKVPFGGVDKTVYIYENTTTGGVFDYLDAMCPELTGGAEPPAAFAVGVMSQRAKSWDITETGYWDAVSVPQSDGRYWNTVGGLAYDPDGGRYRVFAEADYRLDNGEPNFYSLVLSVRKTG